MGEASRQSEEIAAGVEPAQAPTSRFGLRQAALIAEIVGAVAVIISLIFVGVQVSQANDLARDAAEQKQIESMGRISLVVVENPQLADVMARATAGLDVSPGEQIQLTSYLMFVERTQEALYWQNLNGQIDPELWEAHRLQARAAQNNPLVQTIWESRKAYFSKRYREFRDGETGKAGGATFDFDVFPEPRAQPRGAPSTEAPEAAPTLGNQDERSIGKRPRGNLPEGSP